MNVFSTREMATIFWLLIFTFFILTVKKSRKSVLSVLSILFSRNIIIPFILIMSYSGILFLFFSKFKISKYIDLKDVIIWILFIGVPLCYKVVSDKSNKDFFKNIITSNLKLIVFVEFIISTVSFSLMKEIIIAPLFTLLFILESIFSMKKKYSKISKVISYILTVIGFFILYKSFSLAIRNYKGLNSIKTLITILTPISLSVLYLPIIFLFGIYFKHDNIFSRLKIKLKYKFKNNITKNKNITYKFRTEEVNDISTGVSKRKSIILILEEQYDLKDIKNIYREEIYKYIYNNDVIWVYIATNNENYITSNWIVQSQWISPILDNNFRPTKIGDVGKDDINLKYNKSYYILEEYNKKNLFQDDKLLFISNMILYDNISFIYNIMSERFEEKDFNIFIDICRKYKNHINDTNNKYSNIGFSKNIEFEHYLQSFQKYIILIDNIVLFTLDNPSEFENKKYFIKSNMKILCNIISLIEDKRYYWMNKLNITPNEYESSKLENEIIKFDTFNY